MLNSFDAAVVTGVSGELGREIVKKLSSENIKVYGIDKEGKGAECDRFYQLDLEEFLNNENKKNEFLNDLGEWALDKHLKILINNAAYQYVAEECEIPPAEFKKSLDVNLLAPYYLTVELSGYLEKSCGMVVNVSSIHARLSKKGFLAYATTKAALSSLTKSLALVYGDKFRVNCIEPAAIDTKMLRSGFNNSKIKLETLASYHPSKSIGNPGDIADLICNLCMSECRFLNGSVIDVSGGISGKLHDPA
jgi:NAD(P)-dependent dehydrogenase (short-subunit alcohol dehydrogenase family)